MTVGHDIAMSLRAAYLAMHRATEASLAPLGVTADQFVLLAVLAAEDGITQQALALRASSDANTVGAMLVRMEARDLVRRERHPTDGRARRIVLTRAGRKAYARLFERSQGVRLRLQNLFTGDQARGLIDLLACVASGMTEAGPPRQAQRPKRPRRRTTPSAKGDRA